MAANFRITPHQDRNRLHLKLAGDFDGSSAYELINYLNDNNEDCSKVRIIYINTGGLKKVYPFGLNLFKNNFRILKDFADKIKFTGCEKDVFE